MRETPLWFWEVDIDPRWRWLRQHYVLRDWTREVLREAMIEILYASDLYAADDRP
jgi:hypothetical protein